MGLPKMLGEYVHQRLVQIFNDAVIVGVDMDIYLGALCAPATIESR